ncbi:beta-ketothiolase BktB [Aurantiacibacter sp. MUD11]|nr:beta-ketothiolase BktB [Aurantiacibacter sp. MUD11]WAT19306.1 beta-ketothiolase BktB [Aurantiacibacter sp. MUD11]
MENVVIVSAVRTAIGSFGGSLKDVAPAELGRTVIASAIERAKVSAGDIGHVVMGQVMPTCPHDAYLARVAAVNAGVPVEVPAMTLNRLCGSGVQAIVSAAQMLTLGECDLAVAGGAESMSRAPHFVTQARFGQKLGPIEMLDGLTGTLTDPFNDVHMGVTAENVAERHGIDRAAQDALAAESHRRAAAAIEEGRFTEQIVPVEIRSRRGARQFAVDEHPRAETTVEALAQLKPIFRKDGTVTAGNASGINDGAAALILARTDAAERHGLIPRARILGWGHSGVAPEVMGIGPVFAVPRALEMAGVSLADIDVIESNEAFAAQACAVAKELNFDPTRTNVNGSGISLGHPVGATGAIMTVKLLHELERTGGRFGLATMCIGGGQGIALVIERI